MKLVLISPKGPLYRHRGGIFKQNLRYAPLTLTTLAAYVPPDLHMEVEIIDEGIEDVDLNLTADLIGMTVITGSSNRARKCAVKACLLFPLDLHHSGVVDDDFDGSVTDPFQCQQDRLLDCLI